MSRPRMCAAAAVLALAIGVGCGDDGGVPAGPYDDVPLTETLVAEDLDGPVHVVRDEFGILHISATTVRDLGYVQGYMLAHDRLPQMDILRRFGAGTLAELFGALDEDVVESDLEMRMHRMKPLAAETWEALQASSDPRDAEIVDLLKRFADGVNAYNDDLVAGKYELDTAIAVSYDPARFEPWSPVDSLVLGRFQAFALSYTAPLEIDLADIYDRALSDLGADVAADFLRTRPLGMTSPLDGFPNVSEDSGTRSDGSTFAARAKRPRPPRALFENARRFFNRGRGHPLKGMLAPNSGSNNWVVGPSLAGGKALLAGDQHLSLPNPSVFYPMHLVIPGKVDVQGITFPGIPGIVLGHNGNVAWSATVVYHDVNDVYLENLVPCTGGGDCVMFDGSEVPVETWDEEIKIGALGTITETMSVRYERVPHHGPLIPTVENRKIVPRTSNQAFSVKYTGHEVSFEIRAIWGLANATSVEDAFVALGNFGFGAQNWVIMDNTTKIGWTSHAKVPLRSIGSYTYDRETNPGGVAPFLVMPSDGSAEWEGWLDSRYIPHAIDPTKGYIATANSDPVGATFDGDPLNGPVVDGRPLYLSAVYAPGLRTERIDDRIGAAAAAGDITLDDLAAIQHDSQSTVGRHMMPGLAGPLALLSSPNAEVSNWLDTLDPARVQLLQAAATALTGWSLATPTAIGSGASADDIRDSNATAIFNVWMHFFIQRALGDETAAIGWAVHDVDENLMVRIAVALLAEPETLHSGNAQQTGQPLLCDDMNTTPAIESCDIIVLMALDDAVAWLSGPDGYGTATVADWRWGLMHTLTIEPLFPEDRLNVPPRSDPNPDWADGYPKPGDNFVVNRADNGWDDLNFEQKGSGAAQRFLAEVEPGGTIRARMSLPGGTVYHRDSPHYRDLMDNYYIPHAHFDLPYTTAEIVAAAEERWVFTE